MVWITVPERVYDSVQNDSKFDGINTPTRSMIDKHFLDEYGVLFVDDNDYRAIVIDRDKYTHCLLKHA